MACNRESLLLKEIANGIMSTMLLVSELGVRPDLSSTLRINHLQNGTQKKKLSFRSGYLLRGSLGAGTLRALQEPHLQTPVHRRFPLSRESWLNSDYGTKTQLVERTRLHRTWGKDCSFNARESRRGAAILRHIRGILSYSPWPMSYLLLLAWVLPTIH